MAKMVFSLLIYIYLKVKVIKWLKIKTICLHFYLLANFFVTPTTFQAKKMTKGLLNISMKILLCCLLWPVMEMAK